MALSKEILLRIYRDIIRQRALDYQLVKDAKSGKLVPGWHSGLGEDAIVAPVALLRNDDYVTYTHRGTYVWIARGMTMEEILAEFYGKATGCCFGYGGTHVSKPSLGFFGRSGMQGGHFPLAVGMGITAKMNGKDQVVMMFFGEGAGTRGHLHEAFNFASVWKLPIIWICENNGQSMSVKLEKMWAIKNIAKIADNYDMPGKTVDGNDVVAVAEAANEFIEGVRKGQGPALLEMITYRWRGHNEGDPMWGYRTREEVKEWQTKDPVPRFEKVLLAKGLLTQEDILRIRNEADEEVAKAQSFADESPAPNPEEIFSKVYATSHT
jgi:TPP-dependent pyruvate/acetoin dehydrogenase alpha subunit